MWRSFAKERLIEDLSGEDRNLGKKSDGEEEEEE